MQEIRWQLPDGVIETLPHQAIILEKLRRQLLDLFCIWGYELVMPPLMEFTDSLLADVGGDIERLTLKITDQISGRLMGFRADITPQAARIDAHSYARSGLSRLCYVDHVFYAKPKSPLSIRTPLQGGIELFGEAGLAADLEVMSLLLTALDTLSIEAEALSKMSFNKPTLDLGHVGLCRTLMNNLQLTKEQQYQYFSLIQSKDIADIASWSQSMTQDPNDAHCLKILPQLCGDVSTLERARQEFGNTQPNLMSAINDLETIHQSLERSFPHCNVYFDLGEFRGYQYHTGIVFAAYVESLGEAIANGGRYDAIGEKYGRSRPATGFSLNLSSLLSLLSTEDCITQTRLNGIFAPYSHDPKLHQFVAKLRRQGERVVSGLNTSNQAKDLGCDRVIVYRDEQYQVD